MFVFNRSSGCPKWEPCRGLVMVAIVVSLLATGIRADCVNCQLECSDPDCTEFAEIDFQKCTNANGRNTIKVCFVEDPFFVSCYTTMRADQSSRPVATSYFFCAVEVASCAGSWNDVTSCEDLCVTC